MDAVTSPTGPALPSSHAERASTGIGGLDAALDDLRIGDNVVWLCGSLADFGAVLEPFLARSRADGRRIVHVRFTDAAPLVSAPDVEVHELDPRAGFEAFALAVHDLVSRTGRRAFYVFDSLAALREAWHSDLMVMNFFKVTCPFLFELDTIAYFPLLREQTTDATLAGIRETTQLLLDLHVVDGATFIHPLKVDGRSSPTMFVPHLVSGDTASPVTSSEASARLSLSRGRRRVLPDHWLQVVEEAFDALDADPSAQASAHQRLADALIGTQGRMAALARDHLTLADLLVVASRLVGTGHIGGKSVGMLTARAILAHAADGRFEPSLEPHDSHYLGADVFYTYLVTNGWWAHRLAQRTSATFLSAGRDLHALLPSGRFPANVRAEFRRLLDHYGQAPIIVRSSSLLEDNFGNAFAGKYDSFFLANQGSPEERLSALEDAVRAVYASAMSDEALLYRVQRGLADADEQMAVLVQRVSGDHHDGRFFPHAAGVANSHNLYTWDAAMDADAGMVRLVLGLGTRAVDRTTSDHARLVALADPLRGRFNDPDDLSAFSQRRVDVVDLTAGALTSVPVATLLDTDIGADWSLFASPDAAALRRLADRGRPGSRTAGTPRPVVVDFRGLLSQTPFPTLVRDVLATLASAYDHPVDVEFTVNVTADGLRLNLVQCRPLQTRGPGVAVEMPPTPGPAASGVLFSSVGDFMGGNVRLPLARVVLVRPEVYLTLSSPQRHAVARQVGRLNRALAGTPYLLIGPGRWGTTTESLGVPVRFAEISHAAALVEATYAQGGFRPELSYGSHFFQDLVESGIFYAALFDERPDVAFRPEVALSRPNELRDLDPDAEALLTEVVHVVTLPGLELFSDIGSQRVLCLTR